MKAVIIAGGKGTRLYPLTRKTAKCMLPVAGKPILEHIIRHIASYGFKEIIVTLGSKHMQVTDYFGDGSRHGVNLVYSIERRALGTAGSLKNAEKYLSETTLVMQGDVLTNFDLSEIASFHKEKHALVTMALARVKNPEGYGNVVIDRDGMITRFEEKPEHSFSNLVNSGIYVLQREALKHIPANRTFDFARNLFPKLLARQLPVYSISMRGHWFDIGTPASYREAKKHY